MDPQSLPPHPAAFPAAAIHTASTIAGHHNGPDSANSSPRSHPTDTWDEPLPQVPGSKLKLMCSYGGHIIPRPHDKSLCYVGGETRIVVVERHSSIADLHSRLSQSLLNGRHFTLKYQLPNEDLDSLVSITTDEDLEIMIEEYDRLNSASPLKPARLRLFLFPTKPETTASMGCLLDDAKSESWFVDVLNSAGLLPRGLSDSAAIDNLLELDESQMNRDPRVEMENQSLSSGVGKNNQVVINHVNQEIQSTHSDSPMVETTSSFESNVSSPSKAHLPYIKVRTDEAHARKGGLEEQFSQMNIVPNGQKLEERFIHLAATATPSHLAVVGSAEANSVTVAKENFNSPVSDDEKSDHGTPSGMWKPPLPLQPVPRKIGDAYNMPSPDSKLAAGYNLPSPDSVASDSSMASAISLSRQIQQDTFTKANKENRVPSAAVDQRNPTDPNSLVQMQQAETVVMPPPQPNQQQQQLMPAGGHYIQHPATGQVPIQSYYQVYPPPQQQAIHGQMDQQYPMYFLPVTQTQPYNLTMQSNIVDSTSVTASRPVAIANSSFVPSTAYKETTPPLYPVKAITPQHEMQPNVYRATVSGTPTLMQVPSSQFQQQYFIQTPSQTNPAGSNSATNYGYEYAHLTQNHAYYAQHPAATLPQYQTMAPGAAVMLAQTSTPALTTENSTTDQ